MNPGQETPSEGVPDAPEMAADEAPEPGTFAGKLPFWLPVAPMVALDLWSKDAVFTLLKAGGEFNKWARYEVFDSAVCRFEFVNWHNPGTVWGLFQEFNQPLRYVRLLAIAVILWFVYKTPRRARVTLVALGLILAGAFGNLYDNFLHVPDLAENLCAVRDFLYFSDFFGQGWDFPAFNVADSCITVGAGVLFVVLWKADKPK